MNQDTTTTELPEDAEVVGPGKSLAAARQKQGLSTQEVADKLNFRLALVEKIELDQFDMKLPATYNRGYLKNYAKLVHLSEKEVLEHFEMLSAAEEQNAGIQNVVLQSFSKETEKQAENNRLMWVSYLILAILVGSTLMWWLQDGKLDGIKLNSGTAEEKTISTQNNNSQSELANTLNEAIESNKEALVDEGELAASDEIEVLPAGDDTLDDFQNNDLAENIISENSTSDNSAEVTLSSDDITNGTATNTTTEPLNAPVDVSFVFLGDCWVNIYDATGERIAWGIKKAEYEMSITGHPPFSITLGKPELVTIVYDGLGVDMSQFNRGNIAKFSLPLE